MRLKTKFQDEDFAMGEVVEAEISDGGSRGIWVTAWPATGGEINFYFKTKKELNNEFEVCETPRVAYFIDSQGDICLFSDTEVDDWSKEKSIGNYFSTREEAELAVKKLKAFKRLKDKGFEFDYVDEYENLCGNGFEIPIMATMPPEQYNSEAVVDDLMVLFCPEDD